MTAPAVTNWKPVPGYEGLYVVSDHGTVKSIARVVTGSKRQSVSERVLAQMTNGKGYLTVRLSRNNSARIYYVHRLVLAAFVGPAPAGSEACHNDGSRSNNRLSNLRWDTHKNNHSDRQKHGTLNNGEQARAVRLTAGRVLEIRAELASGVTQAALMARFQVSQPTISDIQTRRTWKHI